MENKTTQLSAEQQLIQAREQGLENANNVNSMSAHGKVWSMDSFSWVNPNCDTLATVISSFPFPVIWVGNHDQIKNVLQDYPKTAENIATVIIQDRVTINVERNTLSVIENILCIEGTEFALESIKSLGKEKHIFLFTCEGSQAKNQKNNFTEFISNL